MDYFALKSPRVYLALDADQVAAVHGDAPFKTESPEHPAVVLSPRPTLGMVEAIAEIGEDETEQKKTLIMLAVAIKSLSGDWRLAACTWGVQSPEWPQMAVEGALEQRIDVVRRLLDLDVNRIAEVVGASMTLTTEEEKK